MTTTMIDKLHRQMPRFYNTRTNPNWKAIIEALGSEDAKLVQLMEEVRKQFFIKTADRPYIDKLGANVKANRPRFIGMSDDTYRKYLPIYAYQPKQVKMMFDSLLDCFFFKETTTAFVQSTEYVTFALKDKWTLKYMVDGVHFERINFEMNDFANINQATINEVTSIINKQAKYSFAVVFDDRINKKKYLRIFTNTVGSKGSIQMVGGRATYAFKFAGWKYNVGPQANTVWTTSKIGEEVTLKYTSGDKPILYQVEVDDVVVIDGITPEYNNGTFTVTAVDVANNSFTYKNPFGEITAIDHNANPNAKVAFFSPEKMIIINHVNRAVAWEVNPGEMLVEMPATPPVVKRDLGGSFHLNSITANVSSYDNAASTITVADASDWPLNGGQFILQPKNEIKKRIKTSSVDKVVSNTMNTRFDHTQKYIYTGKTGNVLTGVTPALPIKSQVYEFTISSATRDSNHIITITTSAAHSVKVNDLIGVRGLDLLTPIDSGTFKVESVPSPTTFTFINSGSAATSTTGGTIVVERTHTAATDAIIYLTTAKINTGITGAYMWDINAPYVLSSFTSKIQQNIKAGNIIRTLTIENANNIPNEEGYVIFNFGTKNEEGPVRYFYKPNVSTMQLDPAYIFKNNHETGTGVTVIRKRGAHVMSGIATEYPVYLTDPSVARKVLQEKMLEVKSAGILIDFIIRFPKQLYATLDVYKSHKLSTGLYPVDADDKAQWTEDYTKL